MIIKMYNIQQKKNRRETKIIMILSLCFMCFLSPVRAQESVEIWHRFETTFKMSTTKNPFDIELEATFSNGDTSINVSGFYDGEDTYRIRFMPISTGRWTFVTKSKERGLNNRKGSFQCSNATANNHGPVKVAGKHHFSYSDGKPYHPFGTTAYAWTHMSEDTEELTLSSLKKSGFNKIRMGVFPKNYDLVREVPPRYPFEIKKQSVGDNGQTSFEWDFSRFDPTFFQHLEKRISQLDEIGVEADLILFHPYDKGRWGFDAMSREIDTKYLKYVIARLSSYKNVWWSLANEWDYLKAKTVDDWLHIAKTVHANDPYQHLHSIHGATATYFDYWRPEFTHVSIQDESPVQSIIPAAMLRQVYAKPIVCDEVGYEGNLKSRWGRLSPHKMIEFVLNGVMAGIYVTHGDTYMLKDQTDTIFWAKGGEFKGSSWKNIAFIREIVESCPNPLQMADISRDFQTVSAGKGYYFVYFGDKSEESWLFNLPAKNAGYEKLKAGTRFKIDIIDFDAMTVTPYKETFETTSETNYRLYDKDNKSVRLPAKPLTAIRITEI